MNNFIKTHQALNEGKRGPKPASSESRDPNYFIGYDARDGFNVYCEKGKQTTFRSIEKMSSDEVENFAYQALKPQAEKKMRELKKKEENDDLELKSAFELAQWL